jgi:hypothetical protein
MRTPCSKANNLLQHLLMYETITFFCNKIYK